MYMHTGLLVVQGEPSDEECEVEPDYAAMTRSRARNSFINWEVSHEAVGC